MDGITDNFFDPRTARKFHVDVVEEAKRAGLEPPDTEAQKAATLKLRELEAKRQVATDEARARVVQAPPDSGMGVGDEPNSETPKPRESPLKQQRKSTQKAKEEGAG